MTLKSAHREAIPEMPNRLGIEGIEFIESSSEDGRSTITVQFSVGRDIDSAANDIRDRVSTTVDAAPR